MHINQTVSRWAAAMFVAAITFASTASMTQAGPLGSFRGVDGGSRNIQPVVPSSTGTSTMSASMMSSSTTASSTDRNGADDPIGHDAGDDRGGRRGGRGHHGRGHR
jgi:hypothetical protein